MVALRNECPLAIGLGAGEIFVASSTAAFLPYTHEAAFLRDGELAELHADEVKLIDAPGRCTSRFPSKSTGARTRWRRKGSRPSCSRRSTSSPPPSARRSPATAPGCG